MDFLIAIDIPITDEMKDRLAEVSDWIRLKFPHHRYLSRDEYHCTLKIITEKAVGFERNIINQYVSLLHNYFQNISSFPLKIKGLRSFPDCLFAAVFSPGNNIIQLHDELCNLFPHTAPFERSNFIPHVSLLHFSEEHNLILSEAEKYTHHSFGEMMVSKVNLKIWNRSSNSLPEIAGSFTMK